MSESFFDIWRFVGGLSLFLYGMFLFQYSIKKLGGRYFKKILRKWTDTPIKGIFSGLFSTLVLQSGSVVTLILLGFVGAGIVTFQSSIGVIIGSNIGATITAWIIGFVGFSLDLESLAFPIIGISGILMFMFGNKKKLYFFLLFLFGFGILLFGLNFMKNSFDFGAGFSLDSYITLPIIAFVLIGTIITALVQSSTVCNAITFTALYSGVISFEMAAMMVIGGNIGTTITAIIGSMGGSSNQKQVAFVHLTYNTITAIIVLIFFKPIILFINNILNINGVIGLALFHTIFNFMGAILFYPFISYFAKLTKKIIPDKQSAFHLTIMDINEEEIGSSAIVALQKDINDLINTVINFNLSLFHINPKYLIEKEEDNKKWIYDNYSISDKSFEVTYLKIKKIESYLINFCLQFNGIDQDKKEFNKIKDLDQSIIDIVQSAKMIKDIKRNVDEIAFSDKLLIQKNFVYLRSTLYNLLYDINVLLQKDSIITNKELLEIENKISSSEKSYLEYINNTIKEKGVWGNIKSIFFNKDIEQEEFSDLIVVNNYIYNSTKVLIEGIKKWKSYKNDS